MCNVIHRILLRLEPLLPTKRLSWHWHNKSPQLVGTLLWPWTLEPSHLAVSPVIPEQATLVTHKTIRWVASSQRISLFWMPPRMRLRLLLLVSLLLAVPFLPRALLPLHRPHRVLLRCSRQTAQP